MDRLLLVICSVFIVIVCNAKSCHGAKRRAQRHQWGSWEVLAATAHSRSVYMYFFFFCRVYNLATPREEWFYESTISRWNVYKEWFMIGRSGRDARRERTLSVHDSSTLESRRVIYAQRARGVIFQLRAFTDFLCALSERRNRKTACECLIFAVSISARVAAPLKLSSTMYVRNLWKNIFICVWYIWFIFI